MAFDAKIVITGICAFVPDKEISSFNMPVYGELPTKMWVILPDGRVRPGKQQALDGRDLETHFPVLSFSVDNLASRGTVDLPLDLVTPILFHNVEFILEQDPSVAPVPDNRFRIIQDGSDADFRHGAHIREISRDFVDIDPQAFIDLGDKHDFVGARVLLKQGVVATHDLNKRQKWSFSTSLGGNAVARLLSNQVSIKFAGLSKLTIRLTPFSSGNPRDIVFSRSVDEVTASIGNLCQECSFEELNQEKPLARRRDEDFRWLFELARDRVQVKERLKTLLGTRSLPIPERVGDTSGGGSRLVECMRITYAAYPPAKQAKEVLESPGEADIAEPRVQAQVLPPSEELRADSPYHRQSSDFKCGAAAAMMILVDSDIGVDIAQVKQDDIYQYASGISSDPWHIDPSALASVLNRGAGKQFRVNIESDRDKGSRDIVAALMQYKIPPAVVTEEDDHWVVIEAAVVDRAPKAGEDFVLYGFYLHNPWCRRGCPSMHSVDDRCKKYGTPRQPVTYWGWEKIFRRIDWKERRVPKEGFVSVTQELSIDIGEVRRPPKVVFNGRDLISAIEALSVARLIDEEESLMLQGGELEGPLSVERTDEEAGGYFLYGFVRGGEVVAQVMVERANLILHRLQFENEDSKGWSIFSGQTKSLGRDLLVLSSLRLENAEMPRLVWQPCDESRTPFLPFFDLSDDANKEYLRVDSGLRTSSFTRTKRGG